MGSIYIASIKTVFKHETMMSKFHTWTKAKSYSAKDDDLADLYKTILTNKRSFYQIPNTWNKHSTRHNTAIAIKKAFEAPIFADKIQPEEHTNIANALVDFVHFYSKLTDVRFQQLKQSSTLENNMVDVLGDLSNQDDHISQPPLSEASEVDSLELLDQPIQATVVTTPSHNTQHNDYSMLKHSFDKPLPPLAANMLMSIIKTLTKYANTKDKDWCTEVIQHAIQVQQLHLDDI